jgi:hypothetical protein
VASRAELACDVSNTSHASPCRAREQVTRSSVPSITQVLLLSVPRHHTSIACTTPIAIWPEEQIALRQRPLCQHV